MIGFPAFICLMLLIAYIALGVALFDTRDSVGLGILKLIFILAIPLWLPIALVFHVLGWLAGGHDWRGEWK